VNNYNFWGNSILFIKNILHTHPPVWLPITITLLVTIAIPISYYLFVKNEKILDNFVIKNQKFYNFFLNKWYFDEIYDLIFVKPIRKLGLFFWHKGDIKTIDRFGPDGFAKLIKSISDGSVNFQTGYIYHYAFIMLIGLSILLTYLIVY
jgi:NADH-quinone oxidoreductase subunit L